MRHYETHLYTYAVMLTRGDRISPENIRGVRAKAIANGHTEGECRMVESNVQEYIRRGFSRLDQFGLGAGDDVLCNNEREYHTARSQVLRDTKWYTCDMEYTHFDNIEGSAITRAAYEKAFSVARFPSSAKALTKLAKKMIYTGFVKHRAFDACFEMGNGGEVMAGLITEATQNDILRREIIRCEDYIGAWDTLAAKYLAPASLGGLFEGLEA